MMTSTVIRLVAVIFVVGATVAGHAQQPQIGVPVPPLGAGPFVFDTAERGNSNSGHYYPEWAFNSNRKLTPEQLERLQALLEYLKTI